MDTEKEKQQKVDLSELIESALAAGLEAIKSPKYGLSDYIRDHPLPKEWEEKAKIKEP